MLPSVEDKGVTTTHLPPSDVSAAEKEPAVKTETPERPTVRALVVRATLLTAWGTSLIAGSASLIAHAGSAGPAAPIIALPSTIGTPVANAGAPPIAPAASVLTNANRTLVVFLHPRCPCSDATITQLRDVITRCSGRLTVRVHVLQPSDQPDAWSESRVAQLREALPSAEVRRDLDGSVARGLGVRTSGHVLLYDDSGAVLFSGGVTSARGFVGPNESSNALVRQILGVDKSAAKPVANRPVFGCALYPSSPGLGGNR